MRLLTLEPHKNYLRQVDVFLDVFIRENEKVERRGLEIVFVSFHYSAAKLEIVLLQARRGLIEFGTYIGVLFLNKFHLH